ncbi:MAG: nuclear transport factor 2 family protein [bacterium]
MIAKNPAEVHELFARCFSTGDLEGLMSLYEDDATFLQRDGQSVDGKAAIRQTYTELLAIGGQMSLEVKKIIQTGDLALLFSQWELQEVGTSLPVRSGQTSDVVRRQPDGCWLLIIDVPYGAEVKIDS